MYCLTDEVRDVATQMTDTAMPEDVLESLILRASRIFDLSCGVEPGYFEAAGEDAAESTKVLYGDGTNYLKLPPYVSDSLNATITMPDGYTVLEFVAVGGYLTRSVTGVLQRSYPYFAFGWLPGVPVTVSAVWGYETTPEDVKAAVIELVINLWRETDPAFIKLINIEGQPLREKLPPRVNEIARRYRVRTAAAFV